MTHSPKIFGVHLPTSATGCLRAAIAALIYLINSWHLSDRLHPVMAQKILYHHPNPVRFSASLAPLCLTLFKPLETAAQWSCDRFKSSLPDVASAISCKMMYHLVWMVSIKLLFLNCLYRFLQKIYGPFYHSKHENSSQSSVTAGCFAAVVLFFSSKFYYLCVLCLLPAAPCSANTFFCHSNMCINNSLVCNGVQNCVYPWDENHCKGNYLLSEVTSGLLQIISSYF